MIIYLLHCDWIYCIWIDKIKRKIGLGLVNGEKCACLEPEAY